MFESLTKPIKNLIVILFFSFYFGLLVSKTQQKKRNKMEMDGKNRRKLLGPTVTLTNGLKENPELANHL